MITPDMLTNRAATLPPRQSEAVALVEQYRQVAGELPSFGWLSRRLNISRPSAYRLLSRASARVERATRPTR